MLKPRTCPHCLRRLPVLKGYHFDAHMNLVCGACGRVAFPAEAGAEAGIIQAVRSRSGQQWSSQQKWANEVKEYVPGED